MKWKNDINLKLGSAFPVVLLANKCDKLPQEAKEQVEKTLNGFCTTHGFTKWYLTSARDGIGIDEAAEFLIQTIVMRGTMRLNPKEDSGTIYINDDKKNNPVVKKESTGCCK